MTHDELRGKRDQVTKLGMDALGLDPREKRVFSSQYDLAGHEAELDFLPDHPSNTEALQDDDGTFAFVLGISDPDGDDVIL